MADEDLKGSGAAVTELEELRERIVQLEGAARQSATEVSPRVVQRTVPIWPGGPLVPFHGEDLGERLVRQQYTGEMRAELARAEAVRDEQAEAARAAEPPPPPPQPDAPWSFADRAKMAGRFIDTTSGEFTVGAAPVDAATIRAVDRLAGYHAALDKAEAEKRHKDAFESDDDDTAA